jgi:hypothetical protein
VKDLIIGCYTNYDWETLKFWVNSIEKSGFKGDKAMIVFDSNYDTVQQLLDRNFNIFAFNRDDNLGRFSYPGPFSIVVQRFYHLWQYINSIDVSKYRYVITTDVKDVIFQSDPSKWMSKNLRSKKILVSSESLSYQNEPWGDNNMRLSFPMVHNWMRDKNIWNCGVLAGEIATMRDLFLNLYLSCLGAPQQVPGGGGPDQAALNVLLNLEPYKSITKFAKSEEGWACQAGTTADPLKINSFRPYLLESEPLWDGENSTTTDGRKHCILHQWDRVPNWKPAIISKYG